MVISLGIKPFNTTIEFYDSIKNMPVHRNIEFHKVAMRDAGIGSTIGDFNAHFSKLHSYLSNKKYVDAIQETVNMHNNAFYAIEKIGVWSYSFCTFIKSIDNKPYECTELSEYRDTINSLSKKGLTVGMVEDVIDEVKKNLSQNLNYTFLIGTETLPA